MKTVEFLRDWATELMDERSFGDNDRRAKVLDLLVFMLEKEVVNEHYAGEVICTLCGGENEHFSYCTHGKMDIIVDPTNDPHYGEYDEDS